MTRAEPSLLSFKVSAPLSGQLADLAGGRALVIGYFASRRCAVVTGGFSVSWSSSRPSAGFIALPAVEDVPLYVDRRLLDILRRAEPELRPGGFFRRGTPSIRLARPELWLQFLEGPVVMGPRLPS